MAVYEVETEDGEIYEVETEDEQASVGDAAVQDVKELASGVGEMAKFGGKFSPTMGVENIDVQGVKDSMTPGNVKEVLSKANLFDNPLTRATMDIGSQMGKDVYDRSKEIITDPIGSFKEHPVKTTLDVASVALPAAKALGVGDRMAGITKYLTAKRGPNFLQEAGGKGITRSMGIRPQTVESMMTKGANPADVGSDLGRTLNQEGAVGFSSKSTYDKVNALREKFGVEVGDAIKNIKEAGVPTTVSAEVGLKPILDEWAKLGDSTFSANRLSAKPFEEAYNKLSAQAQKMGGQLSLDDVRAAMDEAGEALNNASEAKLPHYQKMYGQLANSRDAIVNKVASTAGDADLSQNLLKANEGYSRYSRIFSDVAREAAKEGAGKGSFLHNVKKFDFTKPFEMFPDSIATGMSKGAITTGNIMKAVQEAPQMFGKYAKTLMNAAQRGSQAVVATHYMLQQRDPEYNQKFTSQDSE